MIEGRIRVRSCLRWNPGEAVLKRPVEEPNKVHMARGAEGRRRRQIMKAQEAECHKKTVFSVKYW